MPALCECECESSWVGRERERASSFPWDYISLGLGQTRCFLKRTKELSKPLRLFIGLHTLVRRTGLFGQAPPPVPPTIIWYRSGEGRSVPPLGCGPLGREAAAS